jgi:hypothetical protein
VAGVARLTEKSTPGVSGWPAKDRADVQHKLRCFAANFYDHIARRESVKGVVDLCPVSRSTVKKLGKASNRSFNSFNLSDTIAAGTDFRGRRGGNRRKCTSSRRRNVLQVVVQSLVL